MLLQVGSLHVGIVSKGRKPKFGLFVAKPWWGWSTGPKVQTLSLRSERELKWTTTTTNMVENLYFLKGGAGLAKDRTFATFPFFVVDMGLKVLSFFWERVLVAWLLLTLNYLLSLFSPRGVVSSSTIKSWIPFVDSHMLLK